MSEKSVDPTPARFDSYEAAAEFWDTHDTTDYPDEFRTVEVTSEFRARDFEVEIAEDVVKALADKAKQEGVSLSRLALGLFKGDEISLGRAAEIAGLDRWQFEEILRRRGISVVNEAGSAEAMDEELAFFFGLRSKT